MKRVKGYVFLILLILLTGCSGNYNSSPDNVAVEMAKRMSNGDYKNIDELIYVDGNAFIDSVSFKNYLSENDLLIEGNKRYEVIENDEDYSDNSSIKVSIDDNRILQINTIEKDDKWYVNLGEYEFDRDLVIKVPAGSKVYLNDTKLDYKKYAKTEQRDSYWKIGSKKYDYTYSVDTYIISSLLSGVYELKVENKNISTIEEKIYSTKSDYNYYVENDKGIFNSGAEEYIVNARVSSSIENDIKTFMNNYYSTLISSVEGEKDFSSISEFFDATKETSLEKYKGMYNTLLEDLVDDFYTTFTVYNTNLEVKLDYEDSTSGIYYVSDNKYFVVAKTILEYDTIKKYDKGWFEGEEDDVKPRTKNTYVVFDIEKQNNGYIINGGINLMPSL